MSDDSPKDRITSIWRWGMGVLGSAVLGVVSYAAATVQSIEAKIIKLETGYAIEIPALQKKEDKMQDSLDELWRQFYQSHNNGR